jgi:hypothetical protein
VGLNRLPGFKDSARKPYIQAILVECMRYLHIVTLGVPCRLLMNDYHSEYFIAEGSIIIPVSKQSFEWNFPD